MIGLGWIVGSLVVGAVIGAVLWETFGPFAKKILDKHVYRYFKCFVKYVRGNFFGEVELDGRWSYEKEIDESEVPAEFVQAVRRKGRVDVTHDKKLRMQLINK